MADTKTAPATVDVRLNRGIYALNRFLMTLQSKRVPLESLDIAADTGGTRATVRLDCPSGKATRYVSLLAALEDVREIQLVGDGGD